ncbi:DUF6765 family protein [uncultured Oscillibacter sp.]|uniref:DUF6765 family protein n=1 Tax=uncultured Oscillibacter sp. TaxID=876091 RepID=UPI0025CF5274|nr:DUF6765 family protein [uncultured Oscillibacter sp.]
MDLNFHYYVTYSAARRAGASAGDARLIARAARYVDECDGVTVQSASTIVFEDMLDVFDRSGAQRRTQALIWPVFHFLPGDYASFRGEMRGGQGPLTPEKMLICGPESKLAGAVVQGAKQSYDGGQDREKALLRIGIAMHVLADTFAHQGFAGIASYDLNEVCQVKHIVPGKDAAPEDILDDVRYRPGDYSPAPTRSSFGYLGHGRIGTCLDLPCETLHYKAQWHGEGDPWITRYNPLEFYCAYLQMTDAMRYILGGGEAAPFDVRMDRSALIDQRGPQWEETREMLGVFLRSASDEDLASAWYDYTERAEQEAGGPGLWAVQPYEPFGGPKERGEQREKFLKAAKEHLTLVWDECQPLRDYIGGLAGGR